MYICFVLCCQLNKKKLASFLFIFQLLQTAYFGLSIINDVCGSQIRPSHKSATRKSSLQGFLDVFLASLCYPVGTVSSCPHNYQTCWRNIFWFYSSAQSREFKCQHINVSESNVNCTIWRISQSKMPLERSYWSKPYHVYIKWIRPVFKILICDTVPIAVYKFSCMTDHPCNWQKWSKQ